VQNFKQVHPDIDPVRPTIEAIQHYWETDQHKAVQFPIFMRLGRIKK